MIKKMMLLLFLCGTASLVAAQNNVWRTLSKITYKKEYDESMGFKVDVPVFSQDVQALDGKEVVVKGYIIPLEDYGGQSNFVFSAFPYSSCFFCGAAGPETVMQVKASAPIEYTSEQITLRGVLSLNNTDRNELMYAISSAVLVE